MKNLRWINQNHPDTMRIAIMLMYFNAGSMLIFRNSPSALVTAVVVMGAPAAGLAMSHNKNIGYWSGILVMSFEMLYVLARAGLGVIGVNFVLHFVFDIAAVGLLLHDHSRSHKRIWFG
ncbi:MAG: hypothetical protein ACKVKO_06335 [Acidimicrobiales bacterium]